MRIERTIIFFNVFIIVSYELQENTIDSMPGLYFLRCVRGCDYIIFKFEEIML